MWPYIGPVWKESADGNRYWTIQSQAAHLTLPPRQKSTCTAWKFGPGSKVPTRRPMSRSKVPSVTWRLCHNSASLGWWCGVGWHGPACHVCMRACMNLCVSILCQVCYVLLCCVVLCYVRMYCVMLCPCYLWICMQPYLHICVYISLKWANIDVLSEPLFVIMWRDNFWWLVFVLKTESSDIIYVYTYIYFHT